MRSLPFAPTASPTASTGARLSLGWAGSFERYVSLKSRYRTSNPFTNVAHSTLDDPPPSTDAPGLLETRRAHFFTIAYASAGIAPTAVANESINRRFTSCTASRVSFSKVKSDEYRA